MLRGDEAAALSGGDAVAPVERILEALIILFICVVVITSNVIVVAAVATSPSSKEAIDFYILSVSMADLLGGVIVVPLSVYPALAQEWVYGDFLCRFSGYCQITLWCVNVYTFMWIAVDRYLAIRKPMRYDTIQTRTRCQCWMLFSWLTAMFLCSPPLLGFSQSYFYKHGYICMLDLRSTLPYSMTLAILVLAPSFITIGYTYCYIFTTLRRLRRCTSKEDRELAVLVTENLSNPDHLMAFVLILAFWISWVPWFVLRLYEELSGEIVDSHSLHFCLLWLGITDCLWKPVIYITMSPKFRISLRIFCLSLCCKRRKARRQLLV